MKKTLISIFLVLSMCFNMYAESFYPPDRLKLVKDSDYVDLPVVNVLPLDEIMNSTEPQVVVAHIIGMWPYKYPLWVYLAEYRGHKFLIYPAERDEVFEKHGLADYIEEPYQDPYASCKTTEDIIRVIEEYAASKEHNTDIEFELSDTQEPEEETAYSDTTGTYRQIQHNIDLAILHGEYSAPPAPNEMRIIHSSETTVSGNAPVGRVPNYSAEESDNAGDAKDGTCKIELGKNYLFQVVPSKFFRKDLYPNFWATPVLHTMFMNSKYCFRALNLKGKTVYPITCQ